MGGLSGGVKGHYMLKVFLEDERDEKGRHIDNSAYFKNKKIAACGEKYMQKLGKYPVIFLTLKSANQQGKHFYGAE